MALPTTVVEHWEAVTGGLLVEGYGMTETSPVTVGNPIAPTRRPGTVGVPFPSTEVRVVDPHDPVTDSEPGERGELLVRGPQVFAGYWKRPEETAAVLPPTAGCAPATSSRSTTTASSPSSTGSRSSSSPAGSTSTRRRSRRRCARSPAWSTPPRWACRTDRAARGSWPRSWCEPGLPRPRGGAQASREHLTAYKVPRQVVIVDELPRSLIGKVLHREVRDQLLNHPGQR